MLTGMTPRSGRSPRGGLRRFTDSLKSKETLPQRTASSARSAVHSHNITIPAHEHDITPGIYFYGSPKQFDLYVNGKKKTTIVSTDTELDLTQYLVDANSKLIPRGSWLSIEVRPNDLAYVSIDMFVQGFVQSRGDATV